MYKQATRIRKSRQTPASVRRAAPLVTHTAGPGKVKELLDRARKRLVDQGVERNPGPLGFRPPLTGFVGRAVFADKRKELLDRAFARLVEQGIEPHPGPDSDFSWPCEACGQVLWANSMVLRFSVLPVLYCGSLSIVTTVLDGTRFPNGRRTAPASGRQASICPKTTSSTLGDGSWRRRIK